MAKVIDLRNSGGELVVIGQGLVLPSLLENSPSSLVTPSEGSLRFNKQMERPEVFVASNDKWVSFGNNWRSVTQPSSSPNVADATVVLLTGETDVSNFLGGVTGQIIYVRVATDNTVVIKSGADIKLDGGADYTITPNSIGLTLVNVDGIWNQIGFSSGGGGGTGESPVLSVAGKVGNVVLSKADVSLGNVDNTRDLDKPISNATQNALNTKSSVGHSHSIDNIVNLTTELNNKAYITHTHAISEVVNLQAELDSLSNRIVQSNIDDGVAIVAKIRNADGAGSLLDSDFLDGQHGSYYTNADNISSGTLNPARLPTATDSLRGAIRLSDSAADMSVSSGIAATPKAVKLAYDLAASKTTNDTDANLKNRANHTGSQAQSTVTNLVADLASKTNIKSFGALIPAFAVSRPPTKAVLFSEGYFPTDATFTRSGNGSTRINSRGTVEVVKANLPRFFYKGLYNNGITIESGSTNLFPNSLAPVDCIISVTGTNTLSIIGSGSISVYNGSTLLGVAISGIDFTFTAPAPNTTLAFTVQGLVVAAQLESGEISSTPIVTSTTAETRGFESIVYSNLDKWYNPSEGTLIVEGMFSKSVNVSSSILQFDNGVDFGASSNNINLTNNFSSINVVEMGTASTLVLPSFTPIDTSVRLAIRLKSNDIKIARSGANISSQLSKTIPPSINRFIIKSISTGYLGYVKSFMYYPFAMSDQEILNASII